jgi:hypothetical protein
VLRFDDHMLATLHLHAQAGVRSPLLHLQRRDEHGLFDQLAAHFDSIWQAASEPIRSDPDTYPPPNEDPDRYHPQAPPP